MHKNRKSRQRKIVLVIILVTSILLVVGGLWYMKKDENARSLDPEHSKTTSDAATAQEGFSDGQEREVVTRDSEEGVVTDNNGNVGQLPDEASWSRSQDGKITVFTPTDKGILRSGSVVSGQSAYDTVSFRLIDDIRGVLAQGELAVIDGRFSGTFSFNTDAQNGRLDIYDTREDGVEQSNVEIPVRF